jgi:DNA-3-methyladenine glycosylase I
MKSQSKTRCPWLNMNNPVYVEYHDQEWGRPVHDDQHLFEMLILEGAQAGLSWETVLNKRQHYRKVFYNFNIAKCARLKETYLEKLLHDPGIIRNRLKVFSVPKNAQAFQQIQKDFGSFDEYLWKFVNHKPIRNCLRKLSEYPARSEISDMISKDLKKRGFKFVGSTIIYAYLQAIGVVNDHSHDCFLSQ